MTQTGEKMYKVAYPKYGSGAAVVQEVKEKLTYGKTIFTDIDDKSIQFMPTEILKMSSADFNPEISSADKNFHWGQIDASAFRVESYSE